MKNLLIIICLIFSNILFGQSEEMQILDEVISKSKEISLYSKTVDWDSLKKEMHLIAKDAENVDDLKPAFEMLFNQLRDHHATIRNTTDYSVLAHFTDYKNSRKKDSREFAPEVLEIINDLELRFEYAMLPNNIGYLKVVGIGPNVDGQKEAERIRNAIKKLHKSKVKKWVLDLRYNGGGNINVMLAGLAPLLDTQKVVSIQNGDGNMQGTAEIKKGNFWYFGMNAFKMKKKPKIKNPKIAILTSRWTVSSGEFVAVAFKGQKNTKFFGERTGGYTTNNSWDIIKDKIALAISTGVYCDRNGNAYTEDVKPDQKVVFEVETDKSKDTGIIEAVNWLEE